MMEFVRVPRPAELDENDVITLADAARESGRSIAVISAMLDRGSLPWYEYPSNVPGKKGARYTSLSAVKALPKEKRVRPSPRKPAKR
jgi:hypothetical protein